MSGPVELAACGTGETYGAGTFDQTQITMDRPEIRIQEFSVVMGASQESFVDVQLASPVQAMTRAFVRSSSTTGHGRGASGATVLSARDLGLRAELIDTATARVHRDPGGQALNVVGRFQVVEYKGDDGGANEFIVRDRFTVTVADGDVSETVVPLNIVNRDDVIEFNGGWTYDTGDTGKWDSASCLGIVTAINVFIAVRNGTTGDSTGHWQLVEFTGSNWTIVEQGDSVDQDSQDWIDGSLTGFWGADKWVESGMRAPGAGTASLQDIGHRIRGNIGVFPQFTYRRENHSAADSPHGTHHHHAIQNLAADFSGGLNEGSYTGTTAFQNTGYNQSNQDVGDAPEDTWVNRNMLLCYNYQNGGSTLNYQRLAANFQITALFGAVNTFWARAEAAGTQTTANWGMRLPLFTDDVVPLAAAGEGETCGNASMGKRAASLRGTVDVGPLMGADVDTDASLDGEVGGAGLLE